MPLTKKHPLPSNESQRLATLQRLGVLDVDKNECFDRITRVASALMSMPIAMINMVTAKQDVNKSCYGMQAGFKNDRRISFCTYTIMSEEPLIIENASDHLNFKDNPEVTGGMNIKAYVGIPLTAQDGTHPGSLCLVDTQPRTFTADEIELLKDLAHWAELEINSGHETQIK